MPSESPPDDFPGADGGPTGDLPPGCGSAVASRLVPVLVVGIAASALAGMAGLERDPGRLGPALCGIAGYLFALDFVTPVLLLAVRVAVLLAQGQRIDAVLAGPINLWRGQRGRLGVRIRFDWPIREPYVSALPKDRSSLRYRVLHESMLTRLLVEHLAPILALAMAAMALVLVVILAPIGPVIGTSTLRLATAIGAACGLLAATQYSLTIDSVRGSPTYGTVARALRAGGDRAETIVASTLLNRIDVSGTETEAWPPALVRILTESEPEGVRGALDLLVLAAHAHGAGDLAAAHQFADESWHLAESLDGPDAALARIVITFLAAPVIALCGRDPAAARRILDPVTGGDELPPMDRAAEACILEAEGRSPAQVRVARDEAIEFLETLPLTGTIKASIRALKELAPPAQAIVPAGVGLSPHRPRLR